MKLSQGLFRILGLLTALILAGGILLAQTATVQVNPGSKSVIRGDTFTLNVDGNSVSNLLASHVQLTFDNSKLQFNGATTGGLIPAGGFFQSNVSGGTLTVDQSALALGPVNGSGTLLTVSFTALDAMNAGTIGLAAALRDPMNNVIASTVNGGFVTVNNPLPHVGSISPGTKTAGDATFDITVTGTGFVPTSSVWFKGSSRPTTYGTATSLTASIAGTDLQQSGVFPIAVVNPAPGGGTSVEVVDLTINPSGISSFVIDPISTQTAGVSFSITITAKDGFGNTETDFSQPVTLTTTAGSILPGITGSFVGGVVTQSVTLTQAGAGKSISVNDEATPNHIGQSAPFDVNPGPLTHFTFNTIGIQTAGTAFPIVVTAQDQNNNTVTGFSGTVTLTTTAGTISPSTSDAFATGVLTQLVTITQSGTAKTITADNGGGRIGVSNVFDIKAMPHVFVSSSAAVAAAGVLFPNPSWNATAYEPNDWSFLGPPTISVYIVPEPGMTFNNCMVTLTWDATKLAYAGGSFGSQGTPNGLFGSGQSYTHTQSFSGLGANTVTINGARTDGSDFVVAAGDYFARIDFTLLKPGYATIDVQGATLNRLPANPVQVATAGAVLRAYLGDVSSGPSPSGDASGDGKVDGNDLFAWSTSYWSGVQGYAGGMTNYKVKYDFGPTQDGYVFTNPTVDGKIDFEDLVIFSIAYGLSSTGQLPKVLAATKEPMQVSLGTPIASGNETHIGVMIGGEVSDVRAMRLELKGDFGSFLGAEKGSVLQEYNTPIMLFHRSADGHVFVDLAVMGLTAHGLNRPGEVAVLRFEGTPHMQLIKYDVRNSSNQALPVEKGIGAGEVAPTQYGLKQNYPNPFNPSTTIEFEVPVTGDVTLEVYNMLGQKVATLVHEAKDAGIYQVQWDGRDQNERSVASGIFFYRLQAGKFTQIRKMLLLK